MRESKDKAAVADKSSVYEKMDETNRISLTDDRDIENQIQAAEALARSRMQTAKEETKEEKVVNQKDSRIVDESITGQPDVVETDDGDVLSDQAKIMRQKRNAGFGPDATDSHVVGPQISRLRIEGGNLVNVDVLLQLNSLHKEDFKRVLCINMEKICRVLHTDVNNSCFSLRMVFYQNFVGIMEQIVTFLD